MLTIFNISAIIVQLMGRRRDIANRHERTGSRMPAPTRRPSRAEIRMRRAVAGSGILALIVSAVALLESGSDKSTEKVTFNDGNVVLVDTKDKSAEIETKALGITNPAEATARAAGQPITVKCIDYHAVRALQAGDTLTELVIEETVSEDPQIPSSAVADSVAAYNDITAPDGNIDASFAQEGEIYKAPQLCLVEG